MRSLCLSLCHHRSDIPVTSIAPPREGLFMPAAGESRVANFLYGFFTQMKIFTLTNCTHLNKTNLTHTGKGREHGPRPRVPQAFPGGRSPQVPSSASRKPLGAGKHATAGKGKRGWPGRRGPRKNGRVRHGRPKGGGRWRRERRTGGRQLRAARETKTLSDFTPAWSHPGWK